MGIVSAKLRAIVASLVLTPTLSVCVAAEDTLRKLGEALFFDVDLSLSRQQSCASCHEPANAFTDQVGSTLDGAVSLSHDQQQLGDRNTPSLNYAATVPPPTTDNSGQPVGGLFLDGRAADLPTQAAGPLLNPIEMAMPDSATVVQRVREKRHYVEALEKHFGQAIWTNPDRAFRAICVAIASFEQSPPFVAFDSRYDRYLAGEYEMTIEEEIGRRLFFSDLTNCQQCHLLKANTVQPNEPFSDHKYHNIGIPVHQKARAANGLGEDYRDPGRGAVDGDQAARYGQFRTPSLRNIAITAPYMHNGIFQKLETALTFYNQFIVANDVVGINPETGEPWGAPEWPQTVERSLLEQGQPLDDERIQSLITFLKTLTDQQYEHLLKDSPSTTHKHH